MSLKVTLFPIRNSLRKQSIDVDFNLNQCGGNPSSMLLSNTQSTLCKRLVIACGKTALSLRLGSGTVAAFVLSLLVYSPLIHADVSPPASILWDAQSLADTQKAFLAGKTKAVAMVQVIVKEADGELARAPRSVVTAGGRLAASGDPHDYFSMGPYWWPNPDTVDGLPYVRRDGQVNRTDLGDRRKIALSNTITAVRRLSLAWYFSGDKRYAEHAAEILRVWFIRPETRMNPHLRYAQAIPGITDGRGIGIIDADTLPDLIDGVQVLKLAGEDSFLSSSEQATLRKWFSDFLTWFLESENGKDVQRGKNNIVTWYYMQIGAYAIFTGREQEVKSIYEQRLRTLVEHQIAPDGTQPEELSRTQPMGYSVFNLNAWLHIASVGQKMGLDYGRLESPVGKRLHAALHYLAAYAASSSAWPHPEIKKQPNRRGLAPLFLRAKRISGNEPENAVFDAAFADVSKTFPAPAWVMAVYGGGYE